MHKIDSDAATDDNRFTDGDPTIPIAATVVDAAWLNAVQGEIVAIIEAAGITLNKESTTQLKDALEIMLAQWTPDATTTVAGILKLATEALALAGVDDTTAMTPLKTKKLIDASPNATMEAYRKSRIGVPMPVASTTLDDSFKSPDGSLVLFADYPELQEKYEAGGLLVLDSDSTADEQVALPLYFVENSDGTGLYLPRLAGLFARAWTGEDDGTAGGYNEAGLPDATGGFSPSNAYAWQQPTGAFYLVSSNSGYSPTTNTNISVTSGNMGMKLSLSNNIFGNSTTVMPESFNQPLAIYLGQPATTE